MVNAMHRRDIARRILALPTDKQKLAVSCFQELIDKRRAEIGPRPLDAITMAERIGVEPDTGQKDVLRSDAQRILLNCSRQTGKSTVTALLAVHTACYEPDSLSLLLSPSLRQSQELFKKALSFYRKLDTGVPSLSESALRLELQNGARVISLPGKEHTVRGFSNVRLLAVDEAARVPDDLYLSIRPMLAVSGGRFIALSTPFGTRGWWYEAWRSGETWERYEVPASRCPRIAEEFLREERQAMGEWWFAQEYDCQFLDSETQPFGRADVDRAFEEEVEAWSL